MRLLDKKTVNTQVATERKQLIDAGLKLARKVDALRETKQEEEGNLERFRAESIARTKIEIDACIRQRDVLKEEIVSLLEAKRIASIPLTDEWDKVIERQRVLEDFETGLRTTSKLLDQRDFETASTQKQTNEELVRIQGLKQQVSHTLEKADDVLREANESASRIRNEAQTTLMTAELTNQESIRREQEVSIRETQIDIDLKRIEKADKDLTKREKLLADRNAMYLRNLKRK